MRNKFSKINILRNFNKMDCMKILPSKARVNKLILCVISACRKLNSLEAVYAGLFVFFVPSIFCGSDLPRLLTYEGIFRNTTYAQLQQIQKPFLTPPSGHSSHQNHRTEEVNRTSLNEVDGPDHKDDRIGPFFVGFSKDPYRFSIPEKDYLNGIRNIDPQVYMSKPENRGKRGVLHLYNMLYCATGCDPISYKGYGCYCGFLGEGRPTDGIDMCCKLHDQCYENIYCPFYTVYFQPYLWKCYHGEPLCALENFDSQHKFINGCAGRLCECDRQFAMCVRRYRCPRKRALCRSSPIRLLQNLLMFR